jgi:hypothetical protein
MPLIDPMQPVVDACFAALIIALLLQQAGYPLPKSSLANQAPRRHACVWNRPSCVASHNPQWHHQGDNLLGSKDPTFLGKLKNAWDAEFSQNPHLILILSRRGAKRAASCFERGGIAKLGTYLPMKGFAPLPPEVIPDASIEMAPRKIFINQQLTDSQQVTVGARKNLTKVEIGYLVR